MLPCTFIAGWGDIQNFLCLPKQLRDDLKVGGIEKTQSLGECGFASIRFNPHSFGTPTQIIFPFVCVVLSQLLPEEKGETT